MGKNTSKQGTDTDSKCKRNSGKENTEQTQMEMINKKEENMKQETNLSNTEEYEIIEEKKPVKTEHKWSTTTRSNNNKTEWYKYYHSTKRKSNNKRAK